MNKCTPGPWKVTSNWRDTHGEDGTLTVATVPGDEKFFIYADSPADETLEGVRADAHLIAAAPDLLEALERSLDWLASYPGEGTMGDTGPYWQARDAIAKAREEDT